MLAFALDVRGHGGSDKPHQQDLCSYSVRAGDVLHLMDRLFMEEVLAFLSVGAAR